MILQSTMEPALLMFVWFRNGLLIRSLHKILNPGVYHRRGGIFLLSHYDYVKLPNGMKRKIFGLEDIESV